jgi:hypothetical protein
LWNYDILIVIPNIRRTVETCIILWYIISYEDQYSKSNNNYNVVLITQVENKHIQSAIVNRKKSTKTIKIRISSTELI